MSKIPVPIARAYALGAGGHGFHLGLCHTKDLKMVPVATLLDTHQYQASTGFTSPKKYSITEKHRMSGKKIWKV